MLEILLCSLFTILPDYLYRHYAQGKRLGHEITIYSVWYELRYGIVGCLMLAVGLIAVIFYFHPMSTNVTGFFRTIPIVPEAGGRVAEIYVGLSGDVDEGAPIFKLDSAKQQAALDLATRRIAEVEAAMKMAEADIAAADGQTQQAEGAYRLALDELNTKEELQRRNPGIVAGRDIENLQRTVESRRGGLAAAKAAMQSAQTRLLTLLPAEKASAEAARVQAQVDLDKTVVFAGVAGRVEQFALRVGDYVTPFMRPAGVLIPRKAGRWQLYAGFNQIEAQVIKTGMIAEVTCISKPLTIVPMVVTGVQDYIAAGQFRTTDQLIDPQQVIRPGTITVSLEPLYEGGLDGVTPGSSCVANAYSSHHEELAKGDLGFFTSLALHAVDAVGVVHAAILRLQALMLPIKVLVLTGH
jgi:multidrug resistance efflux pump